MDSVQKGKFVGIEEMTPEKLLFNVDGLVFAIGGSDRLDVSRSLAVGEQAPLLAPVRQFVRDHGLVLADSCVMDTAEHGRAVFSCYVPAADRREGVEPSRLTLEDFDRVEVAVLAVWAQKVIQAA